MANQEYARKQLLERIEQLLEKDDLEELRQLLAESRSSDVAEVVEVMDEIARQILFDLLDPKDAGEVLEKIDEVTRSQVVEDMSSDELGDIVATLPPDEAADVISDLSEKQSGEVLEQIPSADSVQIEKLLEYKDDTAGGIMNPELITVNINGTIRDAIHNYRQADPDEEFYYVFVVDDKYRLKGTVRLDTLLRYPRQTPIRDVLDEELPTVGVDTDQEEIANIFRKNDLIVMPVVDKDGVLLGRITVDDIVDVMGEEAEEDAMVMAGTHPAELKTTSIIRAATVRLPWLLLCLLGPFCYTMVYIFFQAQFTPLEWTSILMFVPAIASMGGNSGLQTSTTTVRGLATGDLVALKISLVFFREIRIAVVIACVCGIVAGIFATAILHFRYSGPSADTSANMSDKAATGDSQWAPGANSVAKAAGRQSNQRGLEKAPIIGLAVCLGMFCSIILATTIGLFLPFTLKHLGIDPAISSGPFVTTANDSLGGITYFSLSLLLLHYLS